MIASICSGYAQPIVATASVLSDRVVKLSRENFPPHELRQGEGMWSAARRYVDRRRAQVPPATAKTRTRTALRRSTARVCASALARCGDFWRRGRASGRGMRCGLATRAVIRCDFAHLHPLRVQPLKAEPLSWPGRRTSSRACARYTSRTHGCEPHAQAPRFIPLQERL